MVAKPDDKWGETPCAFVELSRARAASADGLLQWCKKHLAGYKVPRYVVFAEIPRRARGKFRSSNCARWRRGFRSSIFRRWSKSVDQNQTAAIQKYALDILNLVAEIEMIVSTANKEERLRIRSHQRRHYGGAI